MIKVLKWIGISLGSLFALVILVAVILSFVGCAKVNKTRQIQPLDLTIPTDEISLARGKHLVNVVCKSYHGDDLSGDVLLADPVIGTIYTANITGLGERRTEDEMIRAIRHAVGPEGRQTVAMPFDSFIKLSAEDLGAIIAYLKTIPQVEKEIPAPNLSFMGRILLAAGMFGDLSTTESIDHSQPFTDIPEVGVNREYGEYLANFCTGCHGSDLSGKQPSIARSPFAPNLTPGGG